MRGQGMSLIFHGTRVGSSSAGKIDPTQFLDKEGNLILKPSRNFEARQIGVSFTDDFESARDYAARMKGQGPCGFDFGGNIVFAISSSAPALTNRETETFDELFIPSDKNLVISPNHWKVLPVNMLESAVVERYQELAHQHLGFDHFDRQNPADLFSVPTSSVKRWLKLCIEPESNDRDLASAVDVFGSAGPIRHAIGSRAPVLNAECRSVVQRAGDACLNEFGPDWEDGGSQDDFDERHAQARVEMLLEWMDEQGASTSGLQKKQDTIANYIHYWNRISAPRSNASDGAFFAQFPAENQIDLAQPEVLDARLRKISDKAEDGTITPVARTILETSIILDAGLAAGKISNSDAAKMWMAYLNPKSSRLNRSSHESIKNDMARAALCIKEMSRLDLSSGLPGHREIFEKMTSRLKTAAQDRTHSISRTPIRGSEQDSAVA